MITIKRQHTIHQAWMPIRVTLGFCLLMLMLSTANASSEFIMSEKSLQNFDSTLCAVQMSLQDNGYKVLFIQSVDIGLAKAGYHSDKYRIVFFMPTQGVENVLKKNAELADLFPLKITIYRDKGKVYVFSTQSTRLLDASVSADVRAQFLSWDGQIKGIVKNFF
jgi:uncharacterized protein (DUF302 family)